MKRIVLLVTAAAALVGTFVPAVAFADDAACINASEQALTLRKQGKLHDALRQLAVCADAACPGEVKTECASRIAGVDAAMPTLVFGATDGAGNDLRDVKVSMDGAPLVTTLDGRPISVDPGEHTFRFETTGQPAVEKKLVVREGEKDRRESVMLGTPAPAPSPAPAPVAPPVVTPSPSWWTTQRTLAVVAGGVGVAGLVVGGIFGGLAMSDQSQEKTNCSTGGCPNHGQAVADYNTGNDNATVSTVGFIAGGVLLAGGAVLFFTAHDAAVAPSTGRLYVVPTTAPGGSGLLLGGSF
jgi:hypothetical protein